MNKTIKRISIVLIIIICLSGFVECDITTNNTTITPTPVSTPKPTRTPAPTPTPKPITTEGQAISAVFDYFEHYSKTMNMSAEIAKGLSLQKYYSPTYITKSAKKRKDGKGWEVSIKGIISGYDSSLDFETIKFSFEVFVWGDGRGLGGWHTSEIYD